MELSGDTWFKFGGVVVLSLLFTVAHIRKRKNSIDALKTIGTGLALFFVGTWVLGMSGQELYERLHLQEGQAAFTGQGVFDHLHVGIGITKGKGRSTSDVLVDADRLAVFDLEFGNDDKDGKPIGINWLGPYFFTEANQNQNFSPAINPLIFKSSSASFSVLSHSR
jgi:hypothetical protein